MRVPRAPEFYGRGVTTPPAPHQDDSPPPRRRGDRLLHVALACFGIGLIAIVAIFLTPIVTDSKPGLPLYLVALLTPVGFLLALVFALRSGRRAR